MNYRYVMSVVALSVLSLSVAASERSSREKERKKSTDQHAIVCTIPLKKLLLASLENARSMDGVRAGVAKELTKNNVLPDEIDITARFTFDIDTLAQQVLATRRQAGDISGQRVKIKVAVSLDELSVRCEAE